MTARTVADRYGCPVDRVRAADDHRAPTTPSRIGSTHGDRPAAAEVRMAAAVAMAPVAALVVLAAMMAVVTVATAVVAVMPTTVMAAMPAGEDGRSRQGESDGRRCRGRENAKGHDASPVSDPPGWRVGRWQGAARGLDRG